MLRDFHISLKYGMHLHFWLSLGVGRRHIAHLENVKLVNECICNLLEYRSSIKHIGMCIRAQTIQVKSLAQGHNNVCGWDLNLQSLSHKLDLIIIIPTVLCTVSLWIHCAGLWKYHARLVRPGPINSGQVDNFNLLVLGQVQNLYKVNKILYLIF